MKPSIVYFEGMVSALVSSNCQAIPHIKAAHTDNLISNFTSGANVVAKNWYKTGKELNKASKAIRTETHIIKVNVEAL